VRPAGPERGAVVSRRSDRPLYLLGPLRPVRRIDTTSEYRLYVQLR
jgi:hypothetical protein